MRRKSPLVTAFIAFILMLLFKGSSALAADGIFPQEGFNGMTLNYSINGVSVERSEDEGGFTRTRYLNGKVSSGKITVSVSAVNPSTGNSRLHVTINVGTKVTEKEVVSETEKEKMSINLSADVPKGTPCQILISQNSFYGNGQSRGLEISGQFEAAATENSSSPSVSIDTDNQADTSISDEYGSDTDSGESSDEVPIPGVGQVPPPKTLMEVLAGIVAPGIITLILGILTSGSVPPPLQTPEKKMKRTLKDKNGREINLEYDPKTQQWYNTDTGAIFDLKNYKKLQDDFEKGNEANRQSMKNSAFDRDLKNMVERQKKQAKMLKNLQHMERNVLFGSKEAQSLYANRGNSGDIIDNIHKLKENLSDSSRFSETQKAYEKVKTVYGDRITGETISERDLPSDSELTRDTVTGTFSDMMREIATGSSYKSMALRALTGIATGGTSEFGFTSANALYGMKDYVDKGGNSAFEAFKEQAGQVISDAIMDKLGDAVLDKAMDIASSLKAEKKAIKITEKKLKDLKKAPEAKPLSLKQKEDIYLEKLNKSLEDAAADNADLIRRAKIAAAEDPASAKRIEAFIKGREAGAKKVSDIESTFRKLSENPSSKDLADEFNKAVEAVQLDKHAMQHLNSIKGPQGDSIRKAFNQRMAGIYDESLEKAKIRIAKEYGVSPDDVKIVNPTNIKGGTIPEHDSMGFAKNKVTTTSATDSVPYQPKLTGIEDVKVDKSSFDKDVTIRINQKTINPRTGEAVEGFVDVPKADTKRVYNEEFYKANHKGEVPRTPDGKIDTAKIDDYAEKMDQSTTDRLDAEAYGIGDKDLQTSTMDAARYRNLDDVGAVAKTMEFKADEWAKRADKARADAEKALKEGNLDLYAELNQKTEGLLEESMRQTTKQFDNMVVKRIVEVNRKAGFPDVPVAKIPLTLQKAIAIMKKVGKEDGLTAAEAEKALELMNLSPRQVAEMSSSMVESLQKLKY